MYKSIKKIHFVGIGGSGMSGIAEVLLTLGYEVTGSDMKATEVTERLSKRGAKVFIGHAAENVGAAQVVVTSTAVRANNPEVVEAVSRHIPVIPRIEMLSELARLKYTIAVGGTHGKTTTTSMVACILEEAGLDPTFIVGGKVHAYESGARLGQGEFLVAEADESDGSFLKLAPTLSIITNIDDDHLDYHQSMENLKSAFITFANRVPFYGCAVVCLEDANVREILPKLNRRVISYGFSQEAVISARNLSANSSGSCFEVWRDQKNLGMIQLGLSGRHNVLNALAAIAATSDLSVSFDQISSALKKFVSVARRLEFKKEKNGAIWIDDYGHHPTEIRATLAALKERYPGRNRVVIFQPHRYSRTQHLMEEFARSFQDADTLYLLPIYAAGESPIIGVSSEVLGKKIQALHPQTILLKPGQNLLEYRDRLLVSGSVLLTLGAGDVWKRGEELFSS